MVLKFGGTSVGSIERIRSVARRCMTARRAGHEVVVIVSAMAGETNRLLALAQEVNDDPSPELGRERDVVAASGEQVAAGLLALAICRLGGQAQSFLSFQVRILTDSRFTCARIQSIDAAPIRAALSLGRVVVVTGFQGVDSAGNLTTLGRGGSDTSAVAIAAALHADSCDIYTDVDGVYTTDPRVCPGARKLARIGYGPMIEMASLGAKVLEPRSVELGCKHGVKIHVRSSFNDSPGTWVLTEESTMEGTVITGVALDRNLARIQVIGLSNQPSWMSQIFSSLFGAGIAADLMTQSLLASGLLEISFAVPAVELKHATQVLRQLLPEGEYAAIATNPEVAKVSVVGVALRSNPLIARQLFFFLHQAGVAAHAISTAETRISVLLDAALGERVVRLLHEGFGLGASDELQATG